MGFHLLGRPLIQNVTFRPCITNKPHPGPPQGTGPPPGEGALFCGDSTVASWRGMGPRIKSGAGPVSRGSK